MSKVDAQRAMKEARYAALEAQASAARPAAVRTSAPAAQRPADSPPVASAEARTPRPRTRAAVATESVVVGTDPEAVCGHRSIGNKACQRPAGHAEKNHRYK